MLPPGFCKIRKLALQVLGIRGQSCIPGQMNASYQTWRGRGLDGLSTLSTRQTLQVSSSKLMTCKLLMMIHPLTKLHRLSLNKNRGVVTRLQCGEAACVHNINVEMLQGGGKAMILGLYAVLTVVWQCNTIPTDWKRKKKADHLI